METSVRNRTFEILILAVGVIVAIIAGLKSSPIEESQEASFSQVQVVIDDSITIN